MDLQQNNSNQETEQFKFTGNAGEYFGIWLVNHLLTWVTLGIYSAWAKVRTLQYFYGNTELAGGRFQFTASPLKILRGRIIAVLLLILYFTVESIESTFAYIVLATMIGGYFIFAPVLTVFVMSFKLRYSQWRGISFRFNNNFREAYRVYLIPMTLLGVFLASFMLPYNSTEVEEFFGYESPVYQTEEQLEDQESSADDTETDTQEPLATAEELPVDQDEGNQEEAYGEEIYPEDDAYGDDDYYGEDEVEEEEEESYVNPYFFIPTVLLGVLFVLLLPYFDFINTRFLSRNTRLGTARFNFIAKVNDYYSIYSKWSTAALALAGLWALEVYYDTFENIGLWWVLILITVLFIPATRSYFKSHRYNLLLNNTSIDDRHQLGANTTFLSMFWLMVSNSVVVAITFGMMKPWAQVRIANYLMTHSSLDVEGSLDDFVATQEEDSSALAEEVADIFDLDIVG